MKISDYLKKSIDDACKRELEPALLHVCAAVDGTAKKEYPNINSVGRRFRKFIQEYIDIIELMFGGIDLVETVFPFTDNKGHIGMKFEDIIYENFRCHLAHGDELKIGFGVSLKISESVDTFMVDIVNQSMTIPESTIYALGLPCVLSIVNGDQLIGDDSYYYNDLQNKYNIDSWWGQVNDARRIMPFEKAIRVKMDFSNVMPG